MTQKKKSKMMILAQKIAKIEGKKSQARIGDIKEIIKILINIVGKEMAESGGDLGPTLEYLLISMQKVYETELAKGSK